jgi:16S rRNA (cytosine967-C5)-methyltransferase
MSKVKNSRQAAAAMLSAIERGKTLDEAGDRLKGLSPRDAAFARASVLTALRHRRQIEAIMADYIKKQIPRRPHMAHAVLQIGITQLCFMDVPPHAAINETVSALGKPEKPYRGLINAVLRRLTREPPEMMLLPRDNLPHWLSANWDEAYGEIRTDAMAMQLTMTPPLDLSFKSPELADQWLSEHGKAFDADTMMSGHIRLNEAGSITSLPNFKQGDWWVQDLAARLPADLLLTRVTNNSDNQVNQQGTAEDQNNQSGSLLDLCAAPGGKTMQLAATNHSITALDISASRLKRLRENLHRCNLKAELIEADLLEWAPDKQWDGVLLDAPCSATGTLRRHPDIALRRKASGIEERAALQATLLERAWQLTAKGGYLVYCVCSLEPQEGENIAHAFSNGPLASEAVIDPVLPHELPDCLHASITKEGWVRTRPDMLADQGGMDGFFVARWHKK